MKRKDYIHPLIEDLTSRIGDTLCDTPIVIASGYARGGTLTREREDLKEEEEENGWDTDGLW